MERKFYAIDKKEVKELEGKTLKEVMYKIQRLEEGTYNVNYILNGEFVDMEQFHNRNGVIETCLEIPGYEHKINFNNFKFIVDKIDYGMGVACFTNGFGEYIENSLIEYNLYITKNKDIKEDPAPKYKVIATCMYDSFMDEILKPLMYKDSEDFIRLFSFMTGRGMLEVKYQTIIEDVTSSNKNDLAKLYKMGAFPGHILRFYNAEIRKILLPGDKVGYINTKDPLMTVYEDLFSVLAASSTYTYVRGWHL